MTGGAEDGADEDVSVGGCHVHVFGPARFPSWSPTARTGAGSPGARPAAGSVPRLIRRSGPRKFSVDILRGCLA
jgi:hypothetical protein